MVMAAIVRVTVRRCTESARRPGYDQSMDAGRSSVPLWQRFLSGAVAAYPIPRGRTRLRRISSPWLVARLECGAWVRTSGVVEAEWGFFEGGAKEERTSQVVTSFLSNGMTFVDIGANVGYFSLLAASVVGSSGKVIAFEPTPTVADRLRENVLLNRLANVTVIQAAVSERDGHARLFQSADPEANSLYGQPSTGTSLDVATVTLDDELLRRKVAGVHLIKLDAEGSELAVLKGARRVLTTERPAIVMELNPLALETGGTTPEEVLRLLTEYGYRWEEIEGVLWNGVRVTNILATA